MNSFIQIAKSTYFSITLNKNIHTLVQDRTKLDVSDAGLKIGDNQGHSALLYYYVILCYCSRFKFIISKT